MVTLDKFPRGVLIDFDHAAFVDQKSGAPLKQEPSSRNRTGTTPFMAMDLCTPPVPLNNPSSKPERYANYPQFHLPRYDLESFIWVLLWFLIRQRSLPSQSLPGTNSQADVDLRPKAIPNPHPASPPSTSFTSSLSSTLSSAIGSPLPLRELSSPDDTPPIAASIATPPIHRPPPPGTPSQPSQSSAILLRKRDGSTRSTKEPVTWWNTNNLTEVASKKREFAAMPDPSVITLQSSPLRPLMWELLALLDKSYKAQRVRHIEISESTEPRDIDADLEWFCTSGNIFTAAHVIEIVDRHAALLS